MYIGNTGVEGLHHLIFEVLDNSMDEVQAGHATSVSVTMNLTTRTVTVTDNGRGIPTGIHPKTGKSALETVLTVLHAGGKFGAGGYSVSGGLHGVGISVVNALSERVDVQVRRDGLLHSQSFLKGVPVAPLASEPEDVASGPGSGSGSGSKASRSATTTTSASGTTVSFTYDLDVFNTGVRFDPKRIRTRMRELAFLNAGARLELIVLGGKADAAARRAEKKDTEPKRKKGGRADDADVTDDDEEEEEEEEEQEEEGADDGAALRHAKGDVLAVEDTKAGGGTKEEEDREVDVFAFQGGLREMVAYLARDMKGEALHDPIHLVRTVDDDTQVDIALLWVDDTNESGSVTAFANNIRNRDGGTHVDGMYRGVTRIVNDMGMRKGLLKADERLRAEYVKSGLVAAVSVRVKEPQFQGQTKDRLSNGEVTKAVQNAVMETLGETLDLQSALLDVIIQQGLRAMRADQAAKKAKELVKRKSVLGRSTALPGKLADCQSSDPEMCEIFIVEGDSAGGSAKQGRDRQFQAILPLRGKILNVTKATEEQLLKNEEISNLIVALGIGGIHHQTAAKAKATATATGTSSSSSISKEELAKALRYHRIILLTDADVDGAHIRALLLNFLFQYRPELFEMGHVYVGVPPLYKLTSGRSSAYYYDEGEMRNAVAALGEGANYTLQRFKGLGEMMPQQLWDTTMDPAGRVLKKMTVDDVREVEETLNALMGTNVAPRRAMIEEHGSRFSPEDLDI